MEPEEIRGRENVAKMGDEREKEKEECGCDRDGFFHGK
jgi:hypothetical protein